MSYSCFKCGRDITAEAEKAKDETPITVAHIIARDGQKDAHFVASTFAVICPYCQQVNMFPVDVHPLSLDLD